MFDQYYPWKDWLFDPEEEITFDNLDYPVHHVFKYDYPDCGNQLGVHASWDFYDFGKELDVFSGTVGIIGFIMECPMTGGAVDIYNSYVGAFLRYGHIGQQQGNIARPAHFSRRTYRQCFKPLRQYSL